MAKQLDKSRHFATVRGNEGGHEAYMQDGVYFDASGEEIVKPGMKPAAPKVEVKPKVQSQLDKQLAG